ncbi:uncharacterized protein LOC124542708 isoform X4 [Vanessa cardui]|uniref:uncharacterized protein LOC124542708 isoform X4 n=1 Tax=Vanessa cardui TaxID=171605 RepID=UPI001F13C300|nr:uncharacterized protein LOC124542708 isoform X4 [Vanessa cardui]
MSKTLGLNWQCSRDTFSFFINLNSTDNVTKRQILSVIAQIFDPIGLVVPCIVEAKILMQQLWLAKCSWDEPVPASIQSIWCDFQKSLPLLNAIQIPRWVVCDSPKTIQLHVFSDASEKAYGACVYVRSESLDGRVHVHLLTAKSKVAPIKPTTMPRLELCAALLGSRLYTKERTKWCRSSGELKEGDLVVIKDKTSPPLMWPLGRIIKVLPGKDGIGRVADIRTRRGVLRRAFNTICPLPVTAVEDTSTGGVC